MGIRQDCVKLRVKERIDGRAMNNGLAQSIWLNGLILIGKSFNFNERTRLESCIRWFYGRDMCATIVKRGYPDINVDRSSKAKAVEMMKLFLMY